LHFAILVRTSGGYVGPDERSSIPARYDFVSPFSEERAAVFKIGDFNGIIDSRGKWIVPPSLTFVLDFREHLAPVQHQGRWLFLDPDGRPAFDRDFEWARAFSDGLAPVRARGLWGATDKYGKLAVPFRYQDAWSSHGGPLLVKRNDLWGFVPRGTLKTDQWGTAENNGGVEAGHEVVTRIDTDYLSSW
jgi:hypothetical protein